MKCFSSVCVVFIPSAFSCRMLILCVVVLFLVHCVLCGGCCAGGVCEGCGLEGVLRFVWCAVRGVGGTWVVWWVGPPRATEGRGVLLCNEEFVQVLHVHV